MGLVVVLTHNLYVYVVVGGVLVGKVLVVYMVVGVGGWVGGCVTPHVLSIGWGRVIIKGWGVVFL